MAAEGQQRSLFQQQYDASDSFYTSIKSQHASSTRYHPYPSRQGIATNLTSLFIGVSFSGFSLYSSLSEK